MDPISTMFSTIRHESKKIGVDLSDESIRQFETYLRELSSWNRKINLTGHGQEKEIIGNLFIDSLAFSKAFSGNVPSSILDIGSGAGFPGVPLKILDPEISLLLLEPNLKKVSFLHHIIGTLALTNVKAVPKRIEELSDNSSIEHSFDCIVLKALRFDVCLPYVKSLLSENGMVILSRSKNAEFSENIPGFIIQKEISYQLPFDFGDRVLMVLRLADG